MLTAAIGCGLQKLPMLFIAEICPQGKWLVELMTGDGRLATALSTEKKTMS
jgi:hypothetical protein